MACTRYPDATKACTHGPRSVSIGHRYLKINSSIIGVRSDQCVQPVDPGHTLRQPGPGQHPASFILHLNGVVLLRPIITNKKHLASPFLDGPQRGSSQQEDPGDLINECYAT